MQRFFNKPRLMLWWKWKKTWNHPLVVCCRILGTHTVASRCTSVFFGITDPFWKGTDLIQEMDAMRRCKSLHQSRTVVLLQKVSRTLWKACLKSSASSFFKEKETCHIWQPCAVRATPKIMLTIRHQPSTTHGLSTTNLPVLLNQSFRTAACTSNPLGRWRAFQCNQGTKSFTTGTWQRCIAWGDVVFTPEMKSSGNYWGMKKCDSIFFAA